MKQADEAIANAGIAYINYDVPQAEGIKNLRLRGRLTKLLARQAKKTTQQRAKAAPRPQPKALPVVKAPSVPGSARPAEPKASEDVPPSHRYRVRRDLQLRGNKLSDIDWPTSANFPGLCVTEMVREAEHVARLATKVWDWHACHSFEPTPKLLKHARASGPERF